MLMSCSGRDLWRLGWSLPVASWNAWVMAWLVDLAGDDGWAQLLAVVVVCASFAPLLAHRSRHYAWVVVASAVVLCVSGALIPVVGIAWAFTGLVLAVGLVRS